MEDIDVRNVPMLIAAGATTALWLLAMLAVRILRQPIEPDPGPPTSDLGPERPAVANMLVNAFQVRREALPATLFDLATRDVVEIQGIGDMYLVHIRAREPKDGLTPYERRVLNLLQDRAEHGVVPAGALTTGPPEKARAWWRQFRKEVVTDAKRQGLSRDLWSGSVLGWVSGAALVPSPFLYLAFDHWGIALVYAVLALGFIATVREGGRQRHTKAGLSAAARWLGVRRFLREQPGFADLPPSAVAVWGGYLAYGAALGTARSAVRAIPMGAEEDRRAWSAYGGRWRVVRIRYPRVWPPGWGLSWWMALVYAVPAGLIGAAVVMQAVSIAWPEPSRLGPVVGVLLAVPATVGAAAALWSIAAVLGAVADLGSGEEEIRGLVLRLREYGRGESPDRFYAAVDDGRSSQIRAWRLRPDVYRTAGLSEYAGARARVTRRLRYVREIGPMTLPDNQRPAASSG